MLKDQYQPIVESIKETKTSLAITVYLLKTGFYFKCLQNNLAKELNASKINYAF